MQTDHREIVVGTDGSALAGTAVARAAAIAGTDADLVIVCAFAQLPRRTDARAAATLGGNSRYAQALGRDAAHAAAAAGVAIARREGATIAASLVVAGDPVTSLVRVAAERNAQLIVVGAPRERSLADRLLGTVATEVGRQAPCDVLVVRPGTGFGHARAEGTAAAPPTA